MQLLHYTACPVSLAAFTDLTMSCTQHQLLSALVITDAVDCVSISV